MLAHVREKDLQTFESLAAEGFPRPVLTVSGSISA